MASIDPDSGEVVRLYRPNRVGEASPRENRWTTHFRLNAGEISPLTAIGRVTVRLLQLNRPERVAERHLLFAANLLKVPEG